VFLVDTSVLIDLANRDAEWRAWSADALGEALRSGPVSINPIVYAELSVAYPAIETLDKALDDLGLRRLPLPYAAGFLAGRAFLAYRRAGGTRTSPLPDFYVGAHAAVDGLAVITRDPSRIRNYFPTVKLVSPRHRDPAR
jgi:predicted nucleic acid-binding protein